MELSITSAGKSTSKKLSLSDATFNQPYNEGLIHQVVTAYLAGGRQGTKATKSRSDVSGGGKKPWRQKGTGRARAGTIRSPLWRSGGMTFAATPRDFSKKVNRKSFSAAYKSILSELVRQERITIYDELTVAEPKTKLFAKQLSDMKVEKALIVTDVIDTNLVLAARNIPHIYVIDVTHLDPVSLVSADKIIMTVAAVKKLEERFNEQ